MRSLAEDKKNQCDKSLPMKAGIEISENFFCENFPILYYGKSFAYDSPFTNLVTNQDNKNSFCDCGV